MAENGIIGKITGGMAESTGAVREINRENMAAVRADTRANFQAATAPDPGMVRFMQAEGLGGKIRAVAENIKEGARESSEKERARRAEIQSHESYRTLLAEQRTRRQTLIGHSC